MNDMNRLSRRVSRFAPAMAALALTCCILAVATPSTTWSRRGRLADHAAPAAAGAGTSLDWPGYGGDAANTRYAPLTALTTANVGRLRLAWSFRTGVAGRKTSFEATPVVAAGRLYIAAPDDEVFALDPTSGRLLWRFDPRLSRDAWPSKLNRGVTYGDGRVYLATLDARLTAIDAATGRQDWQFQLQDPRQSYFESMAPLYDRGRVVVGVAGGDEAVRGFVAAFDARTGREDWLFDTVPAPDQAGGDTWPNTGAYHHGGGAVWMTPAVDRGLDLLYVTVSNPSPDFNGAPRAGTNLYTNSVVALRAGTGKVAWYFQEVHHDLWDTDPASPPVLVPFPQGGKTVPAVIQAGKTGWLYVLDRRTGRPLTPTPERPVPPGPPWQHAWPTQPEPRSEPRCPAPGLYPREGCIFTPPSETPILIAPGQIGGSAWSPVSYSPRTGLAYIAANTYPMVRSTTPTSCCFEHPPVALPNVRFSGALVGYDVARGRVAWRAPLPGTALAYGGSAVSASDIVFSGESSGYFDARDARTGRLLWRYRTGAGADAAPAVYSVNGREYVAIAAGGNEVIDSPRGDALDVFSLP